VNPPVLSESEARSAGRSARELLDNLSSVILGRRDPLRMLVVGVLSGGHVLVEDVPGTGKTLLGTALARSLGVRLQRVQFNSDVLPSDLLGASVVDRDTAQATFHAGPLADAHLVLVDDINRARPSTQAALLEAMAEGQVSVEGTTYALASPFMIIATQNPAEQEGTFPLPAAQRDRFAIRIRLGYPSGQSELAILDRYLAGEGLPSPPEIMDVVEWARLMTVVRRVHISWAARAYVSQLADELRNHPLIALGPSPRASQMLARAGQAMALLTGRTFVLPDDIKELLVPVFAHRVVLAPSAMLHGVQAETVLEEMLDGVPIPWSDREEMP